MAQNYTSGNLLKKKYSHEYIQLPVLSAKSPAHKENSGHSPNVELNGRVSECHCALCMPLKNVKSEALGDDRVTLEQEDWSSGPQHSGRCWVGAVAPIIPATQGVGLASGSANPGLKWETLLGKESGESPGKHLMSTFTCMSTKLDSKHIKDIKT